MTRIALAFESGFKFCRWAGQVGPSNCPPGFGAGEAGLLQVRFRAFDSRPARLVYHVRSGAGLAAGDRLEGRDGSDGVW